MQITKQNTQKANSLTLVLGGTGKTGRRIVTKLKEKQVSIRIGSRSVTPAFDWNDQSNWDESLKDIEKVYLNYAPDLAIPGATESVKAFVERAKSHGVRHVVLLSGRGEAEAQACEKIVQESGIDWTIVRASWFYQNFSEGAFVDMVLSGQIILPVGSVSEPFIDADDIADVVVAALTEQGHTGEVYEVTGPRLMTFTDIASELSKITGRHISYVQIPHDDFIAGIGQSGAPREMIWLLDYLFSTVLDGRNAYLSNGVQRALRRQPRDFMEYAAAVAETNLWRISA
jgi:uncharacterized protein YbjT (DUF2867 family)